MPAAVALAPQLMLNPEVLLMVRVLDAVAEMLPALLMPPRKVCVPLPVTLMPYAVAVLAATHCDAFIEALAVALMTPLAALVMPPEKVDTLLTLMPVASATAQPHSPGAIEPDTAVPEAVTVPALLMPPEKLEVPWTVIAVTLVNALSHPMRVWALLTWLALSIEMPPAVGPESKIVPLIVLFVTVMPPDVSVPVLQTLPVKVLATARPVAVPLLDIAQGVALAGVGVATEIAALKATSELVVSSTRANWPLALARL